MNYLNKKTNKEDLWGSYSHIPVKELIDIAHGVNAQSSTDNNGN